MLKFRWETEFKETEIGEIPKDWGVRKLGEVVEVEWGNTTLTKKIYRTEGYPVFSATGQDGYADFYDREGEAVIVSAIGAYCGVCFYAKDKWTAIKNTLVLQSKKAPCSIKFLFYFLNDKEKWPELGSGQPFISKSAAEEVLIVYPPLPEQARIATVLSWFDDLIEVKKKQNEILEKTAMAIFKSWFIDFEPFKDEEFVYNEELGREIPKGWEVKRLGDVVKAFKGLSYKSSEKYQENIEGGYTFITLDNFIRGGGFKNEYSWIKSKKIKTSHFVKEGDLIIALTDMTHDAKIVGAPAIVILPNGFDYGVISLDCMKLEPIVENLKYYLYMFLKYTQEDNSTFANGANVLHLMVNNFLVGKLLQIPPPHILQSFHSLVEPLFQKIILNQKQKMTLRKIRDTLLPLLVFGKLRVEEI